MDTADIAAQAKVEMAKAKAGTLRKKSVSPSFSLLEKVAEVWRKMKNAKDTKEVIRQNEQETDRIYQETAISEIIEHDKRKLNQEEVGWKQFKPWGEGQQGDKRAKSLNMATIHGMAKKIMALEWARALGKPIGRSRGDVLETQAAAWKEKQEQQTIVELIKKGG